MRHRLQPLAIFMNRQDSITLGKIIFGFTFMFLFLPWLVLVKKVAVPEWMPQLLVSLIRPLSKPGKGIRFLEFVSLPPSQPSPTGEGAVLRQIQITAVISHMDNYETIAIFAANEFPPPVGEG